MKRAVLGLLLLCWTAAFSAGPILHHKIAATIDPTNHSIDLTDDITIPAGQVKPAISFLLNGNLRVESKSPGVRIELNDSKVQAEDFGMDREDLHLAADFKLNKYTLRITNEVKGDLVFTLGIAGTLHYPITQIGEEYARGFSQTPGLIDEKGVYLAGSTYWLPWFNNNVISFELTTTMADPWSVVSQGKRTLNVLKNGQRTSRWDSPEPMEEVYLIAAQFHEYSRAAGATDVMAFLRTHDKTLADKYLETTSQYLEMYRKLIGAYPFPKFALVENFWETGYGMPSFTLLGEQIIRFPFILHSSYPHELLHNYWGNSVYVDFKTGNWCEGLTAYMADHLIAEQRGQGEEYRRTTLQKFADYVNTSNDFPLSTFSSRTNPSSEAIGYGKSMMMWDMLRGVVGDEQFVRGFQKFYRDNKFKSASFNDIRLAFESVSGKDLKAFFDQWVNRKGAPELTVSGVNVRPENGAFKLTFTLKQIQTEDVFALNIPIVVGFAAKSDTRTVALTQREQTYDIMVPESPLQVQVDPQFHVFRKLHYNEIPPSLSKILGSEDILILLPSKAEKAQLETYRDLAKIWSADSTKKIKVRLDSDVSELPSKTSVWIFGTSNIFGPQVVKAITEYDASFGNDSVRLGSATYALNKSSVVISARHPGDPSSVLVLLTAESKEAVPGLARKLPHYGKYSYLVFEGAEPTNIGKGEWGTSNSPLTAVIGAAQGWSTVEPPKRKALATLDPVFSAERMMRDVGFLASEELQGRGPGSAGIQKAAAYIAEKFKNAGLLPGGDDGTYFQTWDDVVNGNNDKGTVKNVIGIIPGTNPKLNGESVILSAHYDHLGLGWPGANTGNAGKVHYGADDNASGVSVILELAELLGKSFKPQRTVIFVAFTLEESGLRGSKFYVQNMKRFPAKKAIGVVNFDAVGRLGNRKLLVLSSNSAREWKFIFMGASYVTGVETEAVTQDLDASDQTSFIDIGVPGVHIFGGAHEDYHRPGDVVSRIDAAGLVKTATIGREAVLYLADREEPLTFQGQQPAEAKKPQATGERRVSTGAMPDFTFSGDGVKLGEIATDSPAAKSGLQKGDIVTHVGRVKIANLREYSDALKRFQPGDKVEFVYQRDGKEQKTSVELMAK